MVIMGEVVVGVGDGSGGVEIREEGGGVNGGVLVVKWCW